MSTTLSIKGALVALVGLSFAFLGAQFAFAGHNGADVDIDESATCGETTFTASVVDHEGTHLVDNMYLVVHADGETESVNIPTDGSEESITVGPFDEDTTIQWRVFGGGERAYDDPHWNGFGDSDFASDINDYGDEEGFDWVIAGPDDPNPFTTWHELEVEGCDEEAPVVEISSPTDDSTVNGEVDITGSVSDNVELSHYNLSLYPDTTDLSDGGTHSGDRLNDGRWCTTPTSGTVNLSDDFTGELCTDWDTTQYADGDYQIRLAARDAEGNLDNSDPFTENTSSVHVIDITIDNEPEDKNDCKQGGWEDYGFRNQGQCIRYVNTGMDSR